MKIALSAGAAAFVLLAAGGAHAQTWTGPYIGGHAGVTAPKDQDERIVFDIDLNGSFGEQVSTAAGANAFSPGFCDGRTFSPTPAAGCYEDENKFEVGLRAGYDQQFGGLVVGGVAELTGLRLEDSVTAFSTTPAFYTMKRELDGLAAIRARAGFAVDRFLPYVTGGYATGSVDRTFTSNNIANSFTPSGDDRLSGYQAGGGVEAQVAERLTLGLEYLYTRLQDDDFTVRTGPGTAPATNPFLLVNPAGTDFQRSDEEFDFHSVRLVANVRF